MLDIQIKSSCVCCISGKGRGRQVIAVARTADLIIMMLDATKKEIQKYEYILSCDILLEILKMSRSPFITLCLEAIATHWKMYTSIWWYLHILPVLHRPKVVDIGVNTI